MADDARVGHAIVDVVVGEGSDLHGIELVELFPKTFAFAKDRPPAEPGLCSLEQEHLEKVIFITRRNAPFLIVVREVKREVFRRPFAAFHVVGIERCGARLSEDVAVW